MSSLEERIKLCKKFEIGQPVKIRQNITLTDERHSSDTTMRRMAENDHTYTIDSISSDRIHIAGYMWAPEDILDGRDDEPLPLPKTSILFDPKELR